MIGYEVEQLRGLPQQTEVEVETRPKQTPSTNRSRSRIVTNNGEYGNNQTYNGVQR